MPAKTIDGVIEQLTEIVEWAKTNESRLGYFPALYRKVTIRVKEGIEKGEFQNGERMERLDVIFANRYLDAFAAHRNSTPLTKSWEIAFDAIHRWRPVVLQHLLLGMNAHIDLDLGIAAAQTVAPDELPDLKNDFNKINEILGSLVNNVQDELAQVWPLLKSIDKFAGKSDEFLANFGMKITRDQAWRIAEKLSATPVAQRDAKIAELDNDVVQVSKIILNPGYLLRLFLLFVRFGERHSIAEIIEILE